VSEPVSAPVFVAETVVKEVKETVTVASAPRNEYTPLSSLNQDSGPVDPSEDENNVCISCQ
jgi:hypothetical protein